MVDDIRQKVEGHLAFDETHDEPLSREATRLLLVGVLDAIDARDREIEALRNRLSGGRIMAKVS